MGRECLNLKTTEKLNWGTGMGIFDDKEAGSTEEPMHRGGVEEQS